MKLIEVVGSAIVFFVAGVATIRIALKSGQNINPPPPDISKKPPPPPAPPKIRGPLIEEYRLMYLGGKKSNK